MNDALLHRLFSSRVPLIDVRAEVEFAKGAFPTAVNLPILVDAEREKVGICYKHEGPEAAVALGHRLVSGQTRQDRIDGWLAFLSQNPGAYLYCFRGGQRSAIAAEWLAQAGFEVPRIPGGYKAMRRFLLQQFSKVPALVLLGGRTGTGKTQVLKRVSASHPNQVIDLEAHANHRGSAFGKQLTPQPSQVDFENALAIDLLDKTGPVLLEDEGKLIGRALLPLPLQDAMNRAPVVVLNAPMESRVQSIREEYVVEPWRELRAKTDDNDLALARLKEILMSALDAIRKRLGGVGHREVKKLMESAFDAQASGDFGAHDLWIERLLTDYYDPMYDYQLKRKEARVIYSGEQAAVCEELDRMLQPDRPAGKP